MRKRIVAFVALLGLAMGLVASVPSPALALPNNHSGYYGYQQTTALDQAVSYFTIPTSFDQSGGNSGWLRNVGLNSNYSMLFQAGVQRSEEHTSELQSHSDLVCRLLLEK